MGIFTRTTRLLTRWQLIAASLAAIGAAAGALLFVYIFPGAPRIGVIDIPFSVINDDSAYIINQYLDYARRDRNIKAVVIRLSSPGGGAAASELLYLETRKLRNQKPVVIVMNGMVASGGYMMALGASHTYTQPSSLIGNVGVVSLSGPLISPPPAEEIAFSGIHKLDGGPRRQWTAMTEQIKNAFAQMVITERGPRLRLSPQELTQGRLYSGMDAVRLGLADNIGGDADAFRKASELAGLSSSRYRTVNINLETLKRQYEELAPLLTSADHVAASVAAIYAPENPDQPPAPTPGAANNPAGANAALRRLMLYGALGAPQPNPLPGFPAEIGAPNFYYIYTGNGR